MFSHKHSSCMFGDMTIDGVLLENAWKVKGNVRLDVFPSLERYTYSFRKGFPMLSDYLTSSSATWKTLIICCQKQCHYFCKRFSKSLMCSVLLTSAITELLAGQHLVLLSILFCVANVGVMIISQHIHV